jgi:hypothetical protein
LSKKERTAHGAGRHSPAVHRGGEVRPRQPQDRRFFGKRSIELGLTDALGSVRSVARDVVKAEDIVDFTVQENVAERVARKFGAAVGRSVAASIVASMRGW